EREGQGTIKRHPILTDGFADMKRRGADRPPLRLGGVAEIGIVSSLGVVSHIPLPHENSHSLARSSSCSVRGVCWPAVFRLPWQGCGLPWPARGRCGHARGACRDRTHYAARGQRQGSVACRWQTLGWDVSSLLLCP